MLEFWRSTISGLYKNFTLTTLTKGQIKESFKMHNRLPLGIDNIILELIRRGHLIPLEELKNRTYYQIKENKISWIKWILSKVYKYTIQLLWQKNVVIPENTPLVSVAYLNVMFVLLIR